MATIASIPPEILSSIFILVNVTKHSHHLFSESHFRRTLPPSDFPSEPTGSHLGRVCRRWRDVSLATPALWASLHVDLGESSSAKGIVEGLRMTLERAKSHPLSISIQYDSFQSIGPANIDDPDFDSLPIPSRLISLIFNRSDHIHHLNLRFPFTGPNLNPSTFALDCLSHFRDRVRNLRQLVLCTPDDDAILALEPFSNSPLLSSIAITISDDTPLQLPRLPFSNLTEVVLEKTEMPQVVSLLGVCPNIRVANFSLWAGPPGSEEPRISSTLSLQYLETLYLGEVDRPKTSSFACFLDALTMPALKTLSLEACGNLTYDRTPFLRSGEPCELFGHVATLAERSPEIESLHLNFIPSKDQDLILVLEKMPKLRLLDVAVEFSFGKPLTTSFLKGLGREDIAPRLRDLRLSLCQEGTEIENGALEELLKCWMMRPPEYRLQSAYLQMKQSMFPALDLQCLREMQNEGLAVRVASWRGLSCPSGDTCHCRQTEFELLGYVQE
ncbi:hypothetical protein VNI00_018615 [Paramarasmius palmivorus]|uniref:F-box domain-containing protein n=1 Tax=Paramarasmius palmivorus TaxID=297713 RepID=A0AAW0AVP1_9AGAR